MNEDRGNPTTTLRLRRAREWHVYDSEGKRFIDFEQRDGLALLGHRPPGLGRVIKNELDRGCWTAAASPWDRRLRRAVAALLRCDPLRLGWVADRLPATHCELWSGFPDAGTHNPLVVVWRPGLDAEYLGAGWNRADLVELRLPVPLEPTPRLYAALTDCGVQMLESRPPVAVSPLWTAAYAHIAARVGSPVILDQLRQRIGAARTLPLPVDWRRAGPYLCAPMTDAASAPRWAAWHLLSLSMGVLVPTGGRAPIIVPGVLTAHEQSLWRRLSDAW